MSHEQKPPTFGTPAEWAAFAKRRPRFLDRLSRLEAILKSVFLRTVEQPKKADVLVFGLGRQCVDDFFAILMLCGNAEGLAAQKLLRSMFEHVVLLRYLDQHSEEVDLYLDYYHVTKQKRIDALRRYVGKDAVPSEQVTQAQKRYNDVKEYYRTRSCKKCGHKEMGVSWTSLSFPAMAAKVELEKFLPVAYYEPLLQAHPNIVSLLRRLETDGTDNSLQFVDRLNPPLADEVLMHAHLFLLGVLEAEVRRFKLPVELNGVMKDFKHVWDEVPPPSMAVAEE